MTTFTHLYLGKGRVTLAIREDDNGEVSVGIAWCSPKDQFSRALGREVALMQLDLPEETKKCLGFTFTSSPKPIIRIKDEAVARFQHHCDKNTILVPSWAKKDKNYGYVYNRLNKGYTLSWTGDSVVVHEKTTTVYGNF